MAKGSAGGIIQWIRFMLDKASVKQAEQDARDAGRRTAAAMVEALAKGDAASQATAKFVETLQKEFDAKITKIQDRLIQGLGDEKSAQTAADKVVKAFNKKLAEGVAKFNPGMKPGTFEKTVQGLSFGAVDITKGIEGGGMFGQGDLQKLRDRVKSTFQQIRNDWTNVWNIPAAEPISKSLDRDLRKKAGKDAAEYQRLVAQAMKDQQAASSTLTPLGRLYKSLGVDVASLHPLLDKSTTATQKATTAFKGLLSQVGLVVSVYQALRFAISAVKDFAEQDAQFRRLSNTLGDYGIHLSDVQGQLKALADSNLKMGYTNKETVEIFSMLMQLTGDYQKSLKATSVVLDLYRGTTMSLDMATRSVARAIVGSNESLQRQGIYLDENKDALDQLTARFGGEAVARAQSYAGKLDAIHASWQQLKIEIGQQLITGGGGKTWMDQVVADLEGIHHWLQENAILIRVFGIVARGIFEFLGAAVTFLSKSFATLVITIGAFYTVFRLGIGFAKQEFGGFVMIMAEGFEKVFSLVDRWFGTNLKNNFENARKWARNLRQDAQQSNLAVRWEFTDWAKSVWNGTAGIKETPWAPDSNIGKAHSVTAREHQKISRDISNIRKAGLITDDDEAQGKALDALNKKLADMKQAAEDTKDQYKEQVLWLGHVHEAEKAIADIEKLRADAADKRKVAAKLAHEIELNGQLLLGTRDKEREAAAKELDRIEAELNKKLMTQKLSKDDLLETEKNINTIQEFRLRRVQQIETAENNEIARLSSMIRLNVNRQEALDRLHALDLKYQHDLQQAQAAGNLADAQKAAAHLAEIEKAENIVGEMTQERINKLKEELAIAETRKKATQDLFTLQRSLERQLFDPKTLERDKEVLRAEIQQIQDILGKPLNVSKQRQDVTALIDLTKHARTSQKALEDLTAKADEIKGFLTQGNLTDEERTILASLLQKIESVLQHHPLNAEPFFKDLKETLQFELPQMAQNAAQSMSERFTLAFQYILRDTRNINHAVSSMWKGMAAALADELKQMAMLRAKENLAEALTHGARGLGDLFTNPAKAGSEFAAAAQFGAAAAAWSLLAGAAGSLGMSANTAYSNATDFANNRGGSSVDNQNGKLGPDIYIQIDGVDPKNPNHQRLVGDTYRYYRARYGNNIYINGEAA